MPPRVHGINNQAILQPTEKGEMDRFGVDMLTREEFVPAGEFPRLLRAEGSSHPRFGSMAVSKRSFDLMFAGSFYRVTYLYEGYLLNLPEPTYELSGGLGEEPIETHPSFEATLAGTPAAPLNGAVFIDPETGKPTTDDAKGVFEYFGRGVLAGLEAYLSPNALWTKTSFSTTRPSVLRDLGTIEEPDGPNPTLAGRTWMAVAPNYRKRGHIYELRETWEMSGRGGHNELVYD